MSILGNLFRGNSEANAVKFRETLGLIDFGITANVLAVAGQWNHIGKLTIPAQQRKCWGGNDSNGTPYASGMAAYIKLVNESGVQLTGNFRLCVADANYLNIKPLLKESSAKFSASKYDRTQAVLIPETGLFVKEDSILLIQYMPPSTDNETIDYDGTGSEVSLPVTTISEGL